MYNAIDNLLLSEDTVTHMMMPQTNNLIPPLSSMHSNNKYGTSISPSPHVLSLLQNIGGCNQLNLEGSTFNSNNHIQSNGVQSSLGPPIYNAVTGGTTRLSMTAAALPMNCTLFSFF